MELVSDLHQDITRQMYDDTLHHDSFQTTVVLFNKYLNHLRNSNGDLSSYWMSYVDMVGGALLGLLRASREGDWNLHMSAIYLMIPWCFAYDKVNYARYLPVYYANMANIAAEYPEVYESFIEGRFAVQLGSKNPFGRIPGINQSRLYCLNGHASLFYMK